MEKLNTEEEKLTQAYFECPICLDIMFKPTRTPCRHYFCLECLKNHFEYERKCPMCRGSFAEDYIPLVSLRETAKGRQTRKSGSKSKNSTQPNTKNEKNSI